MGIEQLEPLIGEWTMEAAFPGRGPMGEGATATFEWMLGRRFVMQRASAPDPAPEAAMVIGESDGGFTQHYFDDRGIARVYEMTFDGGKWELLRTKPDFTALDFHQRYIGELSADGRAIRGRWESSGDGESWELDFQLDYFRVG